MRGRERDRRKGRSWGKGRGRQGEKRYLNGCWGYRCIKLGHQIQGVIIGIAKGY